MNHTFRLLLQRRETVSLCVCVCVCVCLCLCLCVCLSEGGGGVNARNVKGTQWTETPQRLAVLTGISNEVPVQRQQYRQGEATGTPRVLKSTRAETLPDACLPGR